MKKDDWIKAIESGLMNLQEITKNKKKDLFIEATENNVIPKKYPIADSAQAYSHAMCEEIVIIMNSQHHIDLMEVEYRGEYLIVDQELEVCMLVGGFSINFLPWCEIKTITVELIT